MNLDELLARSKDPGAFVERRTFTLARGKAVEKMRKFTLRTPEQYALELVQAGVFAEADWIFVDATKQSTTVGWIGGRTLKRSELDALFDYLFVGEGPSPNRHLRQLAVVVNALLQRKPQLIRLESGDLDGSVRLDLDGEGQGEVGIPQDGLAGTYLHVRFGADPWFSSRRDRVKVAELVEVECGYSPVPLFVNGEGPLGWSRRVPLANPMLSRQVTFDELDRDGWLGRAKGAKVSEFDLVIGGVRVCKRKIPEFGGLLSGVIRDDSLAKTADMSDVVADHRYLAMLHHLQPLAAKLLGENVELPELEPVVAPTEGPKPVGAIDLDEGVACAVTAHRFTLDSLDTWVRAQPIYWVTPDEVEGSRLRDGSFPGRVVVLDDDAAQTLVKRWGTAARNLHRLPPDQLQFVTEQLVKGREVFSVTVDVAHGLLTLSLQRRGPPPGWRRADGLSVLTRLGGKGSGVATLSLDLPGVWAVLDLDRDDPSDVTIHALTRVIEAKIWALAVASRDAALTRVLLSQAVWLQSDENGGQQARLPSDWSDEAYALFDLPLAGGITARELFNTLGTDGVIEVGAADYAVLAAFFDPFGAGHVACAGAREEPLLEVHRVDGTWIRPMRPGLDTGVTALVRVPSDLGGVLPAGWERQLGPHGSVVCAARAGSAPPDFEGGLELLRTTLDRGRESLSAGMLEPRADLLRLAALALDVDVMLPAEGGGTVLRHQLAKGLVCLRGGPKVMQPPRGLQRTSAHRAQPVALVSVDEARLLGPMSWRLDDPPSLWTPTPDPEGWLVTVPLQAEGTVGWIGLRSPYDPTCSVMARVGLATQVMWADDLLLRCHGWMRTHTLEHGRQALQQAYVALLEALLVEIELNKSPDAIRYAADLALLARLHPSMGIGADLANRLAAAVPVPGGDLLRWFKMPERIRPVLTASFRGLRGEELDPAALVAAEVEDDRVLQCLRWALDQIDGLGEVSVTTWQDQWSNQVQESGALWVVLGGATEAYRRASQGDDRALTLVVLDAVRRLHAHERSTTQTERAFVDWQLAATRAVRSFSG